MPTDIEIARSVTPLPITEVAKNAGVDVKHLIPYGFDKAKVDYSLLNEPTDHQAKLVLVTAINPTPAGEGKTTTTIGLADGLRRRGVKSAVALREPSLGPVFGVKGGAAGGGWAQVTEDLIHIVTTAYFNGMFEPVRHRMDKARALHYVRQLNRYHMAGFETIFHPENFR